MVNENIEVGTLAIAKVGRNEINVEVVAIEDSTYIVRNKAGKEFKARHLEPMLVSAGEAPNNAAPEQPGNCHERDNLKPPVPKKMSILNAAIEVLRRSGQPLNTREIVEQTIALRLWMPTRAKTPERTLYGAIFREIATKEHPRIVRSEQKGKFEFAKPE